MSIGVTRIVGFQTLKRGELLDSWFVVGRLSGQAIVDWATLNLRID